jgi:arylsulfatase A-like enzyme
MNAPEELSTRPNVIWIFGDQHRAQATGYAGDPNVHTPHLDRLAAEGFSFAAVAGTPLCSPYRGSLLTGRYPHHCVPGHEYPLPPDQPTIATAFNAAGYHTAYFGKWHIDGYHEREGRAAAHIVPPERRGDFQDWLGYENNNSQWDCWVHGGAGADATHRRLPGFETDALTDLLIAYIEARGQKAAAGQAQPFFAALSVQPPHDPYLAPAEWMARHTPGMVQLRPNVPDVSWVVERARRDLAGYYAAIENLDWNLGRVRAALDRAGLARDTHIVFFSDHGDLHGSHGQFRKTAPWEESLRVPFILGGRLPRYGDRLGQSPIPLNHVDIAPTTLGLCGLPVPDWMEGTNYAAHRLRDGQPGDEPDSAFLQLVAPTRHGDSVDRPWRGVVTRDGWKYCVLEGQPWLLFNLRDDPYEQVNLAHNTRFAAERRRLHDRLAAWIRETGDAFALPEI